MIWLKREAGADMKPMTPVPMTTKRCGKCRHEFQDTADPQCPGPHSAKRYEYSRVTIVMDGVELEQVPSIDWGWRPVRK